MRRLLIFLLITTCALWQVNAQTLTIHKAEYFFDKDPGVGKGTSLPTTSVTGDSAKINATISIAGLNPGFHILYVRAQDTKGKWGLFEGRSFNIFTPVPAPVVSVAAAEYFFDKDPGEGKGKNLALTAITGDSASILSAIATTGLSNGFHELYVRTRDSKGVWGLFENRTIYISPAASNSLITVSSVEYFFDKDPGVGKGTKITGLTAQGDSIMGNTAISTIGLKSGFHELYIRAKDSKGVWGIFEERLIYISPLPTTYVPVSAAEYFFDKDPGVGKGKPITVTVTGDSASFSGTVSTTGLKAGFHNLYVRVAAANRWGVFEGRTIYIDNAAAVAQPQIIAVEYFFDNTVTAEGKGTPLQVVTPGDSVQIQTTVSTIGLANGAHLMHVRAEDNTGKWGLLETRSFSIGNCKQPLISPFTPSSPTTTSTGNTSSTVDTSICASASIMLTAPSGYTSYKWINDANSQVIGTSQSVTVSPGNYSVILPATSNCPGDTVTVDISGVPTVTLKTGPSGDTLISSSPTGNQWYLNNAVIAGATSQRYIATTSGNYKVLVTNSCYPSGVSSSSVSVSISVTTAVANSTNALVTIYPNPAADYIYITISPGVANNGTVLTGKLIDVNGKVLNTIQFSSDYSIPVSGLSRGMYMLEISSSTGLQQNKIVLQ